MVYYVLLYVIQKYLIKNMYLVLGAVFGIALIVYIFWFPYKYEAGSKGLYGISTLYRWIPYFGFMLMGAMIGMKSKSGITKYSFNWYDGVLFVLSLSLFYGIQFASKKDLSVAPYQIITLLPLAGVIFYFYKICNAPFFERIYNKKAGNLVIMTVSGLCLESYLIQYNVISDKLNLLFPLNIPIIMTMVLIVSYLCRCLARIFSQTFAKGDYEWKKVFALY